LTVDILHGSAANGEPQPFLEELALVGCFDGEQHLPDLFGLGQPLERTRAEMAETLLSASEERSCQDQG